MKKEYNYLTNKSKTLYLRLGISADQGVQPYKYTDKEPDMDHGLNLYDYEARQYDPAIGRFTTMDPLCEKYYSISPYAYCANNPVNAVDPNGKDIKIYYEDENNKWRSWIFNGTNQDKAPKNQFVNDFIIAYSFNVENGGGDNLKKAATSTDFTINLVETKGNSAREDMDTGKSQLESFVRWNPKQGIETKEGYSISPATILEHEMDHAVRYTTTDNFREYLNDTKQGSDSQYDKKEERRVITGSEVKTARANGEFPKNYVRKDHSSGKFIIVSSPISNKKLKYQNP